MKTVMTRYHVPAKLLIEWSDGSQEDASPAHLVGTLVMQGYIIIDPQTQYVSMAGEVSELTRELSTRRQPGRRGSDDS